MKRRIITTKIRASANGETCDLRDPISCNRNPRTTSWCHTGKGTGKRNPEYEAENGVYGCSGCHDAIDFRNRRFLSNNQEEQAALHEERDALIAEGKKRSQRKLRAKGLMP